MTELKSNVRFKDGQIEVNKKIEEQWRSTYTDQILSLESYAKAHPGTLVTVVTAKGEILKFNPKTDRWSKLN